MRISECTNCGARVYLATRRDGNVDRTRYYSEVAVVRLVMSNGGIPRAVPVHGVYRVHVCAAKMTLRGVHETRDSDRSCNKGRTPARLVRARKRRYFPLTASSRPGANFDIEGKDTREEF